VSVGCSGYGGNGLSFQPRPGPHGGRKSAQPLGNYPSVAEAQAAAQQHYERRQQA
jgi:hypothetical protein